MAEEEKMNIMVDTSTGDHYNCYTEDHHHVDSSSIIPNATTSFVTSPLEMYNFESHNSVSHNSVSHFWKGPSSPNSSKPMTDSSDFYHFDDQSSLQRSCVFPNERPSQGLSLSLSSANPSSIGLHSFELVRPQEHHYQHQGYFGKSMSMDSDQQQHHHHDMMIQDRFLGKPGNIVNSSSGGVGVGVGDGDGDGGGFNNHQSAQYNIRSSRYLTPAQELLSEFCNIGSKQTDHSPKVLKSAATTSNTWKDHDHLNDASSSKTRSLSSVEFMELQKKRTKLLQMLEEVDRRYKHYCDQMKAVVSSFEAVAGQGAAKVYSSLASKAMSRHFKCLRDGIVSQIKMIKVAMGEKDISAPGASRGETPRLKTLDQSLRQQRAFQQMTMMDTHPWRPQRGLPERSVSVLRAWLFEHFLHPYPNDVDKHILARQTGLSRSQVSNWFINARVRLWKPMVEEMYMEEVKANQETMEGASDGFNPDPQPDQKPTANELVRIDSECLSSIINHPEKMDHHLTKTQDHDFHHGLPRVSNSFGAVELDFSAYNNHHSFGGGGGGGVSLTLGLQHHGGRDGGGGGGGDVGVNSLFYPRENVEDCQTSVQYSSLLEGDQGQNLPYRNLMGAQLLHDLAG